jgi:hypothetical protein
LKFHRSDIQYAGHHFPEVLDIADKQIIFIAVVRIKGGPTYSGAIQHFLHGNRLEWPLMHQLNQRIAERVSGPERAPVSSWFAFHFGGGLCPGFFRAC